MKEIFKDKKFVVICAIIISIFLIALVTYLINSREYIDIYYRTYTKEKGWTPWSKNGKTSGNNYPIKLIEIKIKSNDKTKERNYVYDGFYHNKWIRQRSIPPRVGNGNDNIYGIKISSYIDKNFYYRTYNDKDGWLEWTNPSNISGNKKYPIKKIEIKIFDKGLILEDNLKDYGIKEYSKKNF